MCPLLRGQSIKETLFSGHPRSVLAKKNIFASILLKVVSIIINLGYVPLLINTLGKEEYGVWLILASFIGWINFFDIGLANGLRNQLGEALANCDYGKARQYVSTTYAIFVLIFVPLAVLVYLLANQINWQSVYNIDQIEEVELRLLSIIVLIAFSIRFVCQIIGVIYLADQKPAVTSSLNVISNILCMLIIIFANALGVNSLIVSGTILSTIPVIVFIAASIISFKTKYTLLSPSLYSIDFSLTRSLLNQGIRFFTIQISSLIVNSSTNILIAQFFSTGDVTSYNIAFKYFSIVTMVYSIFIAPLWSATTEAYTKADFVWIKQIMHKYHILALVLSIISGIMLILSNKVYNIWVGGSIKIPFTLSAAVALQTVIYVHWSPYIAFLNGSGKIKFVSILVIFQSILFIPAAWTMIHLFNFGLASIIMTSILIELPIRIIQPIQYRKLTSGNAHGIWNS